MKVVTAEQMQAMDKAAISLHGIPGLTLMERAGKGCTDEIVGRFGSIDPKRAIVLAGKGNNGGDGYVIARRLSASGWKVAVIVIAARHEITGDAAANLEILPADVELLFCDGRDSLGHCLSDLSEYSLVVDALLGTGLKKEVTGLFFEAIEAMNSSGRPVVAVDIPSGIDASTGRVLGNAVTADLTVTFAAPKLGHILYPGAAHAGRLVVADIGIPEEVMAQSSGYDFVDVAAARLLLLPRSPVAHKGSFGHALIVAGSTGHTGAAALAGSAAVRSGAGLVTLAVPASLNTILEMKTTEAMTMPLDDCGRGVLGVESLPRILSGVEGKSVVAIGPGLSRAPESSSVVRKLVEEVSLPVVMDADGLNALSDDISALERMGTATMILTPHPGEMARLASLTVKEVEDDRIGTACRFASRYGVYLVLKGARTVIASPDGEVAINGSGNPGMASGGMGDVLTGIITALLAQGYRPFDACRLGVFVHGYAADLVAGDKGEIGITATDVIEHLPCSFKRLFTARPS